MDKVKRKNIVWFGDGTLVDQKRGRELKHKKGDKLIPDEEELLGDQIDSLVASRVLADTAKDRIREAKAKRRETAIRRQLNGGVE